MTAWRNGVLYLNVQRALQHRKMEREVITEPGLRSGHA